MAPPQTTTLRVPKELRDRIARIAEIRGTTMLEVVKEAIQRLSRDQWWEAVHLAVDGLEPADVDAYGREAELLDRAAADGITPD